MLKQIAFPLATACILALPTIAQTGTAKASLPDGVSPVVIVQRQFVNQTGAIGPFVLFTPVSDGNFQVSAYVSSASCTFPGSAFDPIFFWTDDAGDFAANVGPLSCSNSGGSGYNSGEQFIHANAGTPVSFQLYANDLVDSYNLYITVIGK